MKHPIAAFTGLNSKPRMDTEQNATLYTGCRSLGTLCPRCYYGKREEVRLRVEMVGESAVSTCGSCGYEVKDR